MSARSVARAAATCSRRRSPNSRSAHGAAMMNVPTSTATAASSASQTAATDSPRVTSTRMPATLRPAPRATRIHPNRP